MSAWRATPPLQPLAAALALCGSCAAAADPLEDTFAPNIGAFILSTNTTGRADGSPGPGRPAEVGTPISVERQLGMGDRTSLRLDGYWRFLERHKIRVMYFDESRSAQKSITDEIVFRGQTYSVNTQLSSKLDTQVAELPTNTRLCAVSTGIRTGRRQRTPAGDRGALKFDQYDGKQRLRR